ncbi:MAG: hypothetical protein IPK80_07185 [Nannocystis sp.]|nr:hypothetical protein [Nannocystis sp.]
MSMAAYASGKACFFTIYDFYIKPALDRVIQRQRYFLRHSLVAAYVRASFDAFLDPGLKSALIAARKMILEHPDRMLIELDDVADDEPGTSPSETGSANPRSFSAAAASALRAPLRQFRRPGTGRVGRIDLWWRRCSRAGHLGWSADQGPALGARVRQRSPRPGERPRAAGRMQRRAPCPHACARASTSRARPTSATRPCSCAGICRASSRGSRRLGTRCRSS